MLAVERFIGEKHPIILVEQIIYDEIDDIIDFETFFKTTDSSMLYIERID